MRHSDEVSCAPSSPTFSARAFRRPLRDQEAADLLDVYRAVRGVAIGGVFADGIRDALARCCRRPHLLYHWEVQPPYVAEGPLVRLGGYETLPPLLRLLGDENVVESSLLFDPRQGGR